MLSIRIDPCTSLLTTLTQWKVLVTDETSAKSLDNVVSVDDILHQNITSQSPVAATPLSPSPSRVVLRRLTS